jgi:hypothetical protein
VYTLIVALSKTNKQSARFIRERNEIIDDVLHLIEDEPIMKQLVPIEQSNAVTIVESIGQYSDPIDDPPNA